uniref:Uncharacterized protein n=1 Tax=Vespula pensylvanica TaxID=30213 RepID=A0A834UBM4_VESPE|nr:hypothetical protein H0235_007437 [Vespula pensylvanica]
MGSHDFTDSQTGRGGLESPSPRSATTAAAAVTTAAATVIVTAAAAAAAAAVTVVTLSRLIIPSNVVTIVNTKKLKAVLESLNPYETAFVINQVYPISAAYIRIYSSYSRMPMDSGKVDAKCMEKSGRFYD